MTLWIEAQLNHLVVAIRTRIDGAAKEMKKQVQDGFGEVRTHLDSLFDIVVKKAPEVAPIQILGSISTGTRIQNVQNFLHAVKTNNEDLNSSL